MQTVRLELVPGDNEARYRVREQLARVSFPSDAVGATKTVTGAIVAKSDGTIVSTESQFQVDLSTLKSDEGMRDRFVRDNVLQTNRFKYATFVPTAVEGLSLPPKAGPLSFKLIGNLTIRDVTKQVTWEVNGTLDGDKAKGTASTSFTFDYFNLTKPNVMSVLSIEDTIKLELDVHFQRVTEQAATSATPTARPTVLPAQSSTAQPAAAPAGAVAKLNLNTATAADFLKVPSVGDRMVREFLEYRPYTSILQFRREIGKYVNAQQVAEYEKYVYVPINANTADADTLQQIPGVNKTIADQLIAGRPYASNDAFLQSLAKAVTADQAAVAKIYLVTR